MKKIIAILLLSIVTSFSVTAQKNSPKKITFPSIDGLLISANLYQNKPNAPVILLCHQARYNKAEYKDIALTLFAKGFTCLAIDQRSGGDLFELPNETYNLAKASNKPTEYLDADQDILAAINYASAKFKKPIILWGSSYSSTLALYFGLENKNVAAVISFSPGDYFADKKGSLKEKLAAFNKPLFVTSSKEEATELTEMLSNLKFKKNQVQFIPSSKGKHGSKALWLENDCNKEYWKAINLFLEQFLK